MIEGESGLIKKTSYWIYFLILTAALKGQINYTTQVQPIFYNHCLECHVSVNGSGALELDSYEYLMQDDSNNGPVVFPFNADSSLLYRVLLRDSVITPNEPICCRMPKNADPLSLEQQTIIYNWINEGAIGPTVSVQKESIKKSPLLRVYPNPFNNKIKISYRLIESGVVSVSIFNIIGKRVKTITRQHQRIGWYSVFWDGTDNDGQTVAGGLYLIGINNNDVLEKLEKVFLIK